ncbi:MAG TPA: hypothetical protein VMH89_05715 [Candidatus Acidoferrum sp.]|nr:hypothetical protein [Candidatus Acidoferrum sp.]
MQTMSLDRYARDARSWRDWGKINYTAAKYLFASGNPFLYFPAATLGHHALETYLKALLIFEGMTVFNPEAVHKLDPAMGIKSTDCVWNHDLVFLAKAVAAKRADFNLNAEIDAFCLLLKMPMKVLKAFELFDPFFSELRYPMEANKSGGIGEDEGHVLDALVDYLSPFLKIIS